jgi:serine/threonine protein kinase, bacterial
VLEYLHRRPTPILHRDIKPSNLVLRGNRGGHPSPNPREDMMGDHMIENHIMVVDFGAVKFLSWLPGTRINAGGYSAPEQLRGKPIPASDLYSVGMTLLFLLTGRSPQDFYDHQGQVRLSDSMLRAYSISKALSDVLITATQTKPRDRYSSARELSRALYRAGQLI